ncbi:carotenoid 9,10(9',10')-cleavage dioxygenase 1-like [Senna tora]|uniref:Carotenoid 9,10(9',10')-cleavage dioxygenase 1-like n=1 Tax=Senna tora TaxID=362788 RepID=A0A834TA59_9FABA|nr:carotenoid 9,10(9',10')-cleavage dioxygenase 1-like [Senna tora]
MDFPLTIDINRLLGGGPLMKYNNKGYARIGVMPRYGDANSIQWFEVKPNCTFHIINSFEDGHELSILQIEILQVVVWGCRALDSLIPHPKLNNFESFSRCYEWRLNLQTGEVKEKDLTGGKVQYMDFPMINPNFLGIKNRYGYTQVVDPIASSTAGSVPKYGGLAKLYFEKPGLVKQREEQDEEAIRVEYHMFEKNVFCTGAAFVPKIDGVEEDEGWIITFVHNEDTGISQVRSIL